MCLNTKYILHLQYYNTDIKIRDVLLALIYDMSNIRVTLRCNSFFKRTVQFSIISRAWSSSTTITSGSSTL